MALLFGIIKEKRQSLQPKLVERLSFAGPVSGAANVKNNVSARKLSAVTFMEN